MVLLINYNIYEGRYMKSEVLIINDKEYLKYSIDESQIESLEYKMIKNNNIIGFLHFDKRYFDGDCSLIYTLDNCISLKKYYKKRSIFEKELIEIFIQITELILSLKDYFLLNKDNIDIKIDRVFYDYKNKKVKLVYIPILEKSNINKKIIDFINDFLSIMDIEDIHSNFVNELQKYVSNSFFSIKGLMSFLKEQQINSEDLYVKKTNKMKKKEVNRELKVESFQLDEKNTLRNSIKTKNEEKLFEKLDIKKEDLLTNIIRLVCIEIIGILTMNIIFEFSNITNGIMKTIIILIIQLIVLIPMHLLVFKQYLKKVKPANKNILKKDLIKNKIKKIEKNSSETCFEIDKGSKTNFNIEDLTYTTKSYLESKGNKIEEKIFINKRNFIIGRKKENTDYYIPNKKISKLHLEFLDIEDELFIKDLNSTNGTYLNGVRIEPEKLTNIYDEDYIKIGDEEYIFRIN